MSIARVGVIGSGYWGPNLIRNFVEMPGSEVVVVSDLNDQRLAQIQTRYPHIKTTRDYRDLFSLDLQAVIIATPPASHYPIAKACLEQGLHALVEKPLTLNSAHAEELIQIAEARGLTLMVGHTFVYNPAVLALKELIDSGELGDIYYLNAVRVNLGLFQTDLNVMWDLAPHDISIFCYLLDSSPVSVSAQGEAYVIKNIHDIAYMNLVFPNNILAHSHVSWLDPCKIRRITVVGSKKMVVYDDIENLEKIKIYDKGVDVLPYTETYGDFQCSYRYGSVVIPHVRFSEPLRMQCQHFLDCIANGTPPRSSGRDGYNVVRVLELADQSLHTNSCTIAFNATEPESSS
jgi:predicted dehydrogenase